MFCTAAASAVNIATGYEVDWLTMDFEQVLHWADPGTVIPGIPEITKHGIQQTTIWKTLDGCTKHDPQVTKSSARKNPRKLSKQYAPEYPKA